MENIDKFLSEYDVHEFGVDASTLGYGPGVEPPTQFETALGNKLPFLLQKYIFASDGFMGWQYVQTNGCIALTVWND